MRLGSTAYRRGSQDDLLRLAQKRGWLQGVAGQEQRDLLPPVRFLDAGSDGTLPAGELQLKPSYRIHLPQALVHGRNLALFVENWVFPGGIAHAFVASNEWRKGAEDLVYFEPSHVEPVLPGAEMLGVVSHWGHFFVDALDRLLYRPGGSPAPTQWIVADPDIFHLRPLTDRAGFIAQVADLVRLLPAAAALASPTQQLNRGSNLLATDLRISTLRATKPSVNGEALRALRDLALARLPADRPALGDFLFVGRRDVKKRFLIGQDDFGDRLQRAHGALTYFPEDHDLQTSIAHFADAQQVILPVGSAKFNLAFCEPGTKVVCITPTGYAAENGAIVQTVRHICESLHLRLAFYGVPVQGQTNHAINRDMVLLPEHVDPIARLLDSL